MTAAPQFTTVTLTEAERAAFLARVRPVVSAEDYRLIVLLRQACVRARTGTA